MKSKNLEIISKFGVIVNMIILLSCLANVLIKSRELAYFNLGALCVLIPLLILVSKMKEEIPTIIVVGEAKSEETKKKRVRKTKNEK